MATRTYCDRCKEEVGDEVQQVECEGDYQWDLCWACYDELQKWMGYT